MITVAPCKKKVPPRAPTSGPRALDRVKQLAGLRKEYKAAFDKATMSTMAEPKKCEVCLKLYATIKKVEAGPGKGFYDQDGPFSFESAHGSESNNKARMTIDNIARMF